MNYSPTEANDAKVLGEREFVEQCMRMLPLMMRAMLRIENNELTKGVVSLPQFGVLDCLRELRESTMNHLSETLRIRPSNLTGIVDRLVALNLVERIHDEADRRVVKTRITKKGERMLERIMKEKHTTLGRLYHCITPAERKTYLRVMDKFMTELSS